MADTAPTFRTEPAMVRGFAHLKGDDVAGCVLLFTFDNAFLILGSPLKNALNRERSAG